MQISRFGARISENFVNSCIPLNKNIVSNNIISTKDGKNLLKISTIEDEYDLTIKLTRNIDKSIKNLESAYRLLTVQNQDEEVVLQIENVSIRNYTSVEFFISDLPTIKFTLKSLAGEHSRCIKNYCYEKNFTKK
ncbi:hypothetical protein NQ317_009600 [Molorchus minor]|uniref:Uncharacterized protein n=1 Tax=Molorchus minor TaxID=1323400 RepID=A0ABQ9IUE0_9CUCU|nr:hypothetical protein NQ317_009600 [Molorchus minor]